MSGAGSRYKTRRQRNTAEDPQTLILRQIDKRNKVSYDDILELYHINKPPCQGCRVNNKDSPNCFCALIPPPGGFRKSGTVWQKLSDTEAKLGPDPQELLRPSSDSPSGLTNLGATCYVNSVLQCLYRIKPFIRGFFAAEPDLLERQSVLQKLALLFGELHFGRKKAVDSAPLAKVLELNNSIQQDGQEFLKLLLSSLEGLLGLSKHPQARRVVKDVFRGTLSHVTRCSKCGQESAASKQVVDFYELELNVKGLTSLEESLDDYLSVEQLIGDNQFLCESCNTRVDATHCSKLRSLPPVLNFQLKRFVFDAKTSTKKKVTSKFSFLQTLDMSSRLSVDGLNGTHFEAPLLYDLSGILIHKGSTANSGHYVANIKDDVTGEWWEFDDELVTSLGSHPFVELSMAPSKKEAVVKETHARGGKVSSSQEASCDAVPHILPVSEMKAQEEAPDQHKNCLTSADAYMLIYNLREPPGATTFFMNDDFFHLPDDLHRKIDDQNKELEDRCAEYKLKINKELSDRADRKQEIKTVLSEISVERQDDKCFWISSSWLRTWADELEPPPIDNSELLCEHGKVPPAKVSAMKRISEGAWASLQSKYGGGPELSADDCCIECVMENARSVASASCFKNERMKIKQMLEDAGATVGIQAGFYYVSKTWLQTWLRRKAAEAPTDFDASPTAAITCPHKALLPENFTGAKRQAVPEEVWKYFLQVALQIQENLGDGCISFRVDTPTCPICDAEMMEVASQQQDLKATKMEERQKHEVLFSGESITVGEKGTMPSVDDFACILHKCRKKRNLAYSRRLHAIMRKSGLEGHRSFGNHLVAMLVEVGSMCDAQQVFDRLTYRNECSWNAIITGYVECGESQHALILYQHMQEDDSVHPSGYTFVALLRACANLKDLERGREIHAEIARKGSLEKDIFVGSTLVSMYAKCGSLAKAHKVLYKLPDRSVVSWNALIAGYAEYGHGEEALICYEEMQREGVSPNAITFVCSLKSCASIGAMDKGRELHAEIARKGLETNLLVGSTLVDMYAKCGSLAKAKEVFDKLPIQDVVSWTALIAGYTEHGYGEEALNSFKHMQHAGVSPNSATFVCSFKACGSIGALDEGRELHAEIAKKGLERDLVVGSTLIDMYAKCGSLAEAQEIFDRLPVRDVVSWTALIAGYAEHGRGKDALNCFERMQHEGISPNAATFVCSLKACGSIGAIDKGGELHAKITRSGLERDHLVSSTLVDMYAKCGSVAKAQEMFEKLSVRDVVSWTSLIAGYAEHGHGEDALNCFEQMQHEGVSPNAATFVCSLKACGSIGSTDKGQALHAEIVTKGLEKDLLIGSTLVDMYAKCGSLSKAQEVFDKLPLRNVVAWNVLIAGYAQLGDSKNIFNIFDRMIGECIKPNLVTFISVLNACSHAGLVEKGQMYFEAMNKDYGILPTFEHHTCMIDLLGRAGQLDKAVAMVKKMPFHPDLLMVWHTVLGACQKWGNVEIGRQAFEHVVRLDEKDAAAYVCMSNIYADADMQEETNDVEATIYADATLYKHCRR